MLRVELGNKGVVVRALDLSSKSIRDGLADGVRQSATFLAADVAAHTPKKSGRAAASVIGAPSRQSDLQAVVLYDKEAFYMRFVNLGAKPHIIMPRKKTWEAVTTSKGIGPRGFGSTVEIRNVRLRRALKLGSGDGEKSGFASMVLHPGIVRPRKTLSARLAANESKIAMVIAESTRKKLLAAQMDPDEWIRAKEWGLV